MPELSWNIASVTENDYDEVAETVKQYTPSIDGVLLPHTYSRDAAETDANGKTAIKTDLTDKGYAWTTEI